MNSLQFDNAWLQALTQFERLVDSFQENFIAEEADDFMSQVLESLTPEQNLQLYQAAGPEAFEQAYTRAKGGIR